LSSIADETADVCLPQRGFAWRRGDRLFGVAA
jgi:hypothetical protein